jgi:hypothetical protein
MEGPSARGAEDDRVEPCGMFVRYFAELDVSSSAAEEALLEAPKDWIPGLALGASARGEQLLTDVGFGGAERVEKLVVIELGLPIRLGSKVVLPMRWRPAGRGGVYPALEGDLELADLGPSRAQLAMTARYTPPSGLLGRLADRALLHRVAEATIKDFVERIVEGLRARLAVARVRPAS